MTEEDVVEVLEKEKQYMLSHGGDRQAKALEIAIKIIEQEPCDDCVSRKAVLDALDKRFDSVPMEQTTEILLLRKDLRELPPVTPKGVTVTDFADRCRECGREKALDKIRAEIKEWYWQADKQALAKDPCVVDAMIDLFIRTIDKYMVEMESK